MKRLVRMICALLIVTTGINQVSAQNTRNSKQAAKAAAIKQLVDSKNYTIEVNYAYPAYGGQRYLTPYYDFKVTPDTVASYLPYFGVAYSGVGYNNNNDDNGIKFTSTRFDYSTEVKKNGTWYVVIKPNDTKFTYRVGMYISPSGSADITVISNNRQSIRFTGNIKQKTN